MNLGNGVPAALTCGLVAEIVTCAVLRVAMAREEPAEVAAPEEP